MVDRSSRIRLSVAIVLAGTLSAGGCTPYQPVVQQPGQSWAEARAAAQRAAARAAIERAADRTHRVERGDSVDRLAKRYDVSAREIVAANRLAKPYTLRTGQTLVIPGRPVGPPPLPAPEAPATVAQDRAAREAAAAAAARDRPAREAAEVRVAALDPPVVPTPAAPLASRPPSEPPRGSTSLPGQPVTAGIAPSLPEPDAATLRRAQEATPPPLSGEGFLQPVEGRVVSGFGDKPDGRRNDGINLAAPRGTPVKAAENGIVVYAGESIPGFGRLLLIRHADGFTTAYGHLDRVLVAVGDRVERGQVVARVGDTGDVKTAQLHFQLRSGAKPIDPRPHLVRDGVQLAARPAGRGSGG
jgi:murein DD-endopeptidase MepM/ murein hydrolase activator NlpD